MPAWKFIQTLCLGLVVQMMTGNVELIFAQGVDSPDQQTVELLVRQLGDRSFSRRQLAAEKLWSFGPNVARYLEPHRKHVDVEIAHRVSSVLAAIELGLDSSTPYPIARMILDFDKRESQVQNQVFNNLRSQTKYLMLLELISKLDDAPRKKSVFQDYFSTYSIIERLALEGRWDEIKEVVSHPVVWEFAPEICIYWSQLNGELTEEIAKLKSTVQHDLAQSVAKSKEFDKADERVPGKAAPGKLKSSAEDVEQASVAEFQTRLKLLIRMLRVVGRRQEALDFAIHIAPESTRSKLRNRLWMELGDWKKVSSNLTDPGKKPDYLKDQLGASFTQQIVAHHFADSDEQVQRCLAELKKQFQKVNKAAEDKDQIRSARNRIANVYIFLEDWDNAVEWIDEDRPDKKFELLVFMNRIDEAFQVVDLPSDFSKRIVWFERLRKRMVSIDKQYKRSENDRFEAKSRWVFRMGVAVATQLGTLGFVEEAQLHLRTLADSIDKGSLHSIEKRLLVLDGLIKLECYEAAWELTLDRFAETESSNIVSRLFPNRSETLGYWQSRIKRVYSKKEPFLRLVGRLASSPMFNRQSELDLAEVFSIASNEQKINIGLFNYHIAKFHLYDGNFIQSNEYLQRSAEQGYAASAQELALNANLVGDFEQVIRFSDLSWRRNQNALSCSLLAEAHNRLGDFEVAKNFLLLGYSRWKDAYRSSEITSRFLAENEMHLLERLLNVVVHGPNSKALISETNRVSLAESQVHSDPESAYRNLQIGRFNRFSDPDSILNLTQLNEIRRLKVLEMIVAAKNGELDRVQFLVDRHGRVHKGDTDVGKQLLPLLKQLGHDKLANSILNQLSESYFEILLQYPESPTQNNNYAWLLATSGSRLDFARQHAEIAVGIHPNNSSYLDTLAEIHFLSGDREKALELSKRCIQINPRKRNYWRQYFRFGGSFEGSTSIPSQFNVSD